MQRLRRLGWFARILLGAAVLFLLAQAVPYGRDHSNPAGTRELRFDSKDTEELFADACADCHSDHTTWPWYSNVAPASWLVQSDVEEGRTVFDVSRWDTPQPEVDELVEEIAEGGMPPLQYKLIHGAARLSDAEKRRLGEGLRRSYEADPPG
jgi:mono/diheme cytochrome c family protein